MDQERRTYIAPNCHTLDGHGVWERGNADF
jgi:hypothetical protein